MTSRFDIKATAVLRLIDAVTGEGYDGSGMRIKHPSGLRANWKRDGGFLVFTSSGSSDSGSIELSFPDRIGVKLDLARFPKEDVENCFLYPNCKLKAYTGWLCIEGRTAPKSRIYAIEELKKGTIMPVGDLAKGDKELRLISQFGIMPPAIELISDGKRQILELFKIPGKRDLFITGEQVMFGAAKRTCVINSAWVGCADEDGAFALFLKGVFGRKIKLFSEAYPKDEGKDVEFPEGAERLKVDLRTDT